MQVDGLKFCCFFLKLFLNTCAMSDLPLCFFFTGVCFGVLGDFKETSFRFTLLDLPFATGVDSKRNCVIYKSHVYCKKSTVSATGIPNN